MTPIRPLALFSLALALSAPVVAQTTIGTNTTAGTSVLPGTVTAGGNPSMWLDANDLSSFTYSTDYITTWGDRSGNSNSIGQIISQAMPVLGTDPNHGREAVYFDGNDQMANVFNVGNPYTIYSVSSLEGSQNRRLLTSTTNNWLLGYWNGGEHRMYAQGWVNGSGGPGATTNLHYYGATGDGTNTRFYDGTTDLTGNPTGGLAPPAGISLGSWQNWANGEASRGYVSELLVFDRVLNATERTDLANYLSGKWNSEGNIPDTDSVTINAGVTLTVDRVNETMGQLIGPGDLAITNSGIATVGNGVGSGTHTGTISGTGDFVKTGAGTQTLSGNNTHSGTNRVEQGTLLATSNNALGNAGTPTDTVVSDGASLALQGGITVANENLTLSGDGSAAGQSGALVSLSGNNTVSGDITLGPDTNATIAADADTLRITGNIDMRSSDLTFDGAGCTEMAGVISGSPLANLAAGTTTVSITADGQTFDAFVENDGTDTWLLIGRGRQGWEFDRDGQGAVGDVSTNVGTTAAFAPAAYSDAIVQRPHQPARRRLLRHRPAHPAGPGSGGNRLAGVALDRHQRSCLHLPLRPAELRERHAFRVSGRFRDPERLQCRFLGCDQQYPRRLEHGRYGFREQWKPHLYLGVGWPWEPEGI